MQLIIGASSQIGLEAIQLALETTDVHLHLFLRDRSKLNHLRLPSDRVTVFEGSANKVEDLLPALTGVDYVLLV